MMARESEPKSQESLIFKSPEKAQEFVERVEGRTKEQEKAQGVTRDREIMAEEVAKEIEKEGEESVDLTQPWEHTPEEHRVVQELVEVAFREDLVLALKKARKSKDYPRVIDLFHDVLTGQMYEAVVQSKINQKRMSKMQLGMLSLAGLLLIVGLLVFMLV